MAKIMDRAQRQVIKARASQASPQQGSQEFILYLQEKLASFDLLKALPAEAPDATGLSRSRDTPICLNHLDKYECSGGDSTVQILLAIQKP